MDGLGWIFGMDSGDGKMAWLFGIEMDGSEWMDMYGDGRIVGMELNEWFWMEMDWYFWMDGSGLYGPGLEMDG